LLASGDGAMGLWTALEEVFPQTRHQRCWFHYAEFRVTPMWSGDAAPLVVSAR
jgi:transposase-like protein